MTESVPAFSTVPVFTVIVYIQISSACNYLTNNLLKKLNKQYCCICDEDIYTYIYISMCVLYMYRDGTHRNSNVDKCEEEEKSERLSADCHFLIEEADAVCLMR